MRRRRYRKSPNLYELAQQLLPSARLLLQLKSYARIMTVMMPREKWTDERLDDLNAKVDDVKTEMREGLGRIDADIRELRSEMNARFEAANRNLIAVTVTIVAAIIGSNAFF
jgi:hypothetical protein